MRFYFFVFVTLCFSMNVLAFGMPFSKGRRLASVEPTSFGSNEGQEPRELPPEDDQSVLPARWERVRATTRLWTLHTFLEIRRVGGGMEKVSPSDVEEFCPSLPEGDTHATRNFYTYLLSSMAQLESDFNPDLFYRENFKNSKGEYVVSRGLLQLSLESANYYGCGFQNEEQLHNPSRNLTCGLKILSHWIRTDGSIAGHRDGKWRGGARYWSVLRVPRKVDLIKSWTRSYCTSHFG